MSQDTYAKISEKMKREQFTEEEIQIVIKAKEQLSSYTTGGSVIGGATGLMLAKAKNFKGLQAVAVATGGFFIGSQLGLVMGAMSSIKTIQSIPNFQRVLNIVQEVREENSGPGGATRHDRAAPMPPAGHQRFPVQPRRSELMTDDAVQEETQPFQEFKNGDGYHDGNDPSGNRIGSARLEQNSAWAQAEQKAKEIHDSSLNWSQIRQQNMPKSAWNDVRDGRRPGPQGSSNEEDDEANENGRGNHGHNRKPTTKGSSWDRIRQGDGSGFVNVETAPDGPSEFPRTREDLESRPSRKRNQYGDSL
ncbi:hypothetical protein BG011_007557 [Mortierella polycephala]|uniref:Uncharacterized protein n=1 Tax=Mortierella polycephala TaxID=41804 RepID=A0A9P6PPV9_9FUNG|nr:hypothetical protein BG011_007557 [Mortierella polycephala]